MKRLLIYFVLLFFTQIIVLLILGEFKIYEIPYTKSFNTNNNLLVYKSVHSFDFKMRLKHLYIYYFITYFYLTLVHTGLIFFCNLFNKKVIKLFVYMVGMFFLSFIFYFIHAINTDQDLERILWFYFDAVFYYHIYTICIFMLVNLIFSLLFFDFRTE